ncbi:ATP-binding cassette domain-containing protein [Kribbella capetownensis]|uniref:ATP-binding cassette domain-containing protein n=1 Tax=Kribbella capetownensis TaxID=1572659 RepID=UPI00235726A3|nr:ATP-binding cassette domain-containing protein [Kribbella capetownensis]
MTLDFLPGTFTAVMGPSGSGKSTLLHCAGGLACVDTGEVVVGHQDRLQTGSRRRTTSLTSRASRTTWNSCEICRQELIEVAHLLGLMHKLTLDDVTRTSCAAPSWFAAAHTSTRTSVVPLSSDPGWGRDLGVCVVDGVRDGSGLLSPTDGAAPTNRSA